MNETQWKRMLFKNCKIYAQVTHDGKLLVKNGSVKIKYQLSQEKEYLAHASSIKKITDEELKAIENKKERKEEAHFQPKNSPPTCGDFGDNTILVFTDGACTGNPGPAGIGIFLHYQNHKKELSRFIGNATNNIAELTAIKVALQEIKDSRLPVTLFTDSSYCFGVLTSTLKPKKNQKLVEDIKQEMTRFCRLKFIKVEGHKGIEGNEKANALAQEAIANKKQEKM